MIVVDEIKPVYDQLSGYSYAACSICGEPIFHPDDEESVLEFVRKIGVGIIMYRVFKCKKCGKLISYPKDITENPLYDKLSDANGYFDPLDSK